MTNDIFSVLILNIANNKTDLISNTLSNYSYSCEEKYDVESVLAFLENNTVNLIILNTDFSDIEAEESIRMIQEKYDIKIIFLTSDTDQSCRNFLQKYALLDYKIKLNNLLEILSEVHILIERIILNSKENILIIKRDSDVRKHINMLLNLRSYNVILASHGATGWKELNKLDKLSLVILDLNISDMDSNEIISKVKHKFSSDVPIIALTMYYDPIILQQNIANGLSDFLKIPILNEEFNLKIDLWIDNVRQKREIKIQKENVENNLKSFNLLTNATIEGLLMFEQNSCVEINDEALALFGYKSKKELLGKSILDIVSSDIKEHDKEELIKDDVDHIFELDMKKKDGTIFPTRVKERNLILEDKNLKVIAVLDMTDIRRKEQMLSQQSKMASMGEMIGNIAHQWRQPLTSISISASGIRLNKELGVLSDEDMNDQLDSIVESTAFLSNTISDFQSFLKGTQIKEDYTMQKIVSRVLKLIEGNIKKEGITVISRFEDDVVLNGFANELVQALLNVINNAKDAYENNDTDIKPIIISSIYKSRENKIYLTIQDGAGGIPSTVIRKVFDPYFTTKHQTQGTGLGLFMTHKMITENMNGSLSVENKRFNFSGKTYYGAEFSITLPLDG